ncbi:MAG: Sec-independent protein translocase subunit TatA/TatB [bacterium]
MEKIIFIGLAVLLIFGPEKVPSIARTLGNLVREFQNALHPTTATPPSVEPLPAIPTTPKKRQTRRSKPLHSIKGRSTRGRSR